MDIQGFWGGFCGSCFVTSFRRVPHGRIAAADFNVKQSVGGRVPLREEVIRVSEDNERPSIEQKAEERSLLARVIPFAPLFAVLLKTVELLLKVLRIIR